MVKAFEPVDVYPCTIDEGYLDLSVSIASLFGHLCFGTTFAHDKEMELLASQRETLTRGANDFDFQSMPSSRQASVNQREASPLPSVLASESDPEFYALDELDRVPKRLRTSPTFLRNQRGDPTMGIPTEVSTLRQSFPELKRSFGRYLSQSRRENLSAPTKFSNPDSNHVSSYIGTSQTPLFSKQEHFVAPNLRHNTRANTVGNEHSDRRVGVGPGTQAEPIELSDGDSPSQSKQDGDFLLDELPDPDDIPGASCESHLGSETQVTISDTVFESQSPHNSNPDSRPARLQQRKEAYKAARSSSGIWGVDHGLISSSAHHGNEEVEL